jgi:hypothetical protein
MRGSGTIRHRASRSGAATGREKVIENAHEVKLLILLQEPVNRRDAGIEIRSKGRASWLM